MNELVVNELVVILYHSNIKLHKVNLLGLHAWLVAIAKNITYTFNRTDNRFLLYAAKGWLCKPSLFNIKIYTM